MKQKLLLVLTILFVFIGGCADPTVFPTSANPSSNPSSSFSQDGTQPSSASQPGGSSVPTSVNVSSQSVTDVWPVLQLVEAYPALTFNQPLEFLTAGDGTNRVFVVEKTGKIHVFDSDPQVKAAMVFLDLTSRVDSASSEKGLLGMAFHPQFAQNGFFYVNYTDRSNTVIARYQADPANPGQGLPGSGQVILTIPQPFANHNGGHLAFGPDGYLYIGMGDGGSGGDPNGNAQNRASLLGKMLRIDVDRSQAGRPYAIPADNPFVGNTSGYREEIYAYGLRNPWKFSFDNLTGRLWVADVGQNVMEEIDLVEKGLNYGWNRMEGSLCYPESANCDRTGLQLPVWEYRHPLGESITGGYVYHGKRISGLEGVYIYGDFGSGLIWGLKLNTAATGGIASAAAENHLLVDSKLNISSFGVSPDNELVILDLNGKIYKFKQVG